MMLTRFGDARDCELAAEAVSTGMSDCRNYSLDYVLQRLQLHVEASAYNATNVYFRGYHNQK